MTTLSQHSPGRSRAFNTKNVLQRTEMPSLQRVLNLSTRLEKRRAPYLRGVHASRNDMRSQQPQANVWSGLQLMITNKLPHFESRSHHGFESMVRSCSLVQRLAKQHTQIDKSIRITQGLALVKQSGNTTHGFKVNHRRFFCVNCKTFSLA